MPGSTGTSSLRASWGELTPVLPTEVSPTAPRSPRITPPSAGPARGLAGSKGELTSVDLSPPTSEVNT